MAALRKVKMFKENMEPCFSNLNLWLYCTGTLHNIF